MGSFVVFTVFIQEETVGGEGCHGVEEGEDTDGDKELSRGRVVPNQEEALAVLSFTGGSIKVDLMEPDNKENNETEGSRAEARFIRCLWFIIFNHLEVLRCF